MKNKQKLMKEIRIRRQSKRRGKKKIRTNEKTKKFAYIIPPECKFTDD